MERTSVIPSVQKKATSELLILAGAAAGTLFEWYDFYVYGALASYLASHFFSAVNETTGFILALAGFAVGFLVRPVGALVFGRAGDRLGRKATFLVTLLIMGLSTLLMGFLPDYSHVGLAAPLGLLMLRVSQGLAVGGEYAGAITYVGEHAPQARRGLYVSLLPATASLGLLLSLLVIAGARAAVGAEAFAAWGWRIPFLFSLLLLGISLWIRLSLPESPEFARLKAQGGTSATPLADSFLRWRNLKTVLVALAMVSGQAVAFYTTTFYALFFLGKAARFDLLSVTILLSAALPIGAVLAVASGALCDRVGRRPVLLTGLALAALFFLPLFDALLSAANPGLALAQSTSPVVIEVNPQTCSLQFDVTGRNQFSRTACDIGVGLLARTGTSYVLRPEVGSGARLRVGSEILALPDVTQIQEREASAAITAFQTKAHAVLARAGYADGNVRTSRWLLVISILVALSAINALCSAPAVVALSELFPAQIRYSAIALPQNVANGWVGGLLPASAFAIVAATGNVFAGLWYPVMIAVLAFLVCFFFLPETRQATSFGGGKHASRT